MAETFQGFHLRRYDYRQDRSLLQILQRKAAHP
jgi:hypothetical protein